jgi:hypothetical protein
MINANPPPSDLNRQNPARSEEEEKLDDCAICQLPLSKYPSGIQDRLLGHAMKTGKVQVLHPLHLECIRQTFASQARSQASIPCPLCRDRCTIEEWYLLQFVSSQEVKIEGDNITISPVTAAMWEESKKITETDEVYLKAKTALTVIMGLAEKEKAEEGDRAIMEEQLQDDRIVGYPAALAMAFPLWTTAAAQGHQYIIERLLEVFASRGIHGGVLNNIMVTAAQYGHRALALAIHGRLKAKAGRSAQDDSEAIDAMASLMKAARTGEFDDATHQHWITNKEQSKWVYQNPLVNLFGMVLMQAAERGHWPILELILENASPNTLSTTPYNPIRAAAIAAARAQNLAIIKLILELCGPRLPYESRAAILMAYYQNGGECTEDLSWILTLNPSPATIEDHLLSDTLTTTKRSLCFVEIIKHMKTLPGGPMVLKGWMGSDSMGADYDTSDTPYIIRCVEAFITCEVLSDTAARDYAILIAYSNPITEEAATLIKKLCVQFSIDLHARWEPRACQIHH